MGSSFLSGSAHEVRDGHEGYRHHRPKAKLKTDHDGRDGGLGPHHRESARADRAPRDT